MELTDDNFYPRYDLVQAIQYKGDLHEIRDFLGSSFSFHGGTVYLNGEPVALYLGAWFVFDVSSRKWDIVSDFEFRKNYIKR